jgi:hypothetical protein
MRSGIVVDLPLTAVSSQFVIGSFEARFFCAAQLFATDRLVRDLRELPAVTDRNLCLTID